VPFLNWTVFLMRRFFGGYDCPFVAKQTCVASPTLRLLSLLFCRRFLSEKRDTLFRNLLRNAARPGKVILSGVLAEQV
jgi:hypothetical protein